MSTAERVSFSEFEVLADSTAAYDRGPKFNPYRRLGSLAEYVLVEQRERSVIHFARGERGQWILTEYPPGDVVHLPCLGLVLPLDEIYRHTDEMPCD